MCPHIWLLPKLKGILNLSFLDILMQGIRWNFQKFLLMFLTGWEAHFFIKFTFIILTLKILRICDTDNIRIYRNFWSKFIFLSVNLWNWNRLVIYRANGTRTAQPFDTSLDLETVNKRFDEARPKYKKVSENWAQISWRKLPLTFIWCWAECFATKY